MAMMLGRGSGGVVGGVSSFSSSLSSSSSGPSSSSYFTQSCKPTPFSTLPLQKACKSVTIGCSAVQESSTSTVTAETTEAKTAKKEAPSKAKPPAKATVKPLPQKMEDDVIPSLKAVRP